jgi:diguanylate cyclase (GGDEF)-like protein
LKYFVIGIYVAAICIQIYSIISSFWILKKFKAFAFGIMFMPLGLLVILGDKLYYLLDCCIRNNFSLTDASFYLFISVCLWLGVVGLQRLFITLDDQREKLEKISKHDHLTGALSRLELEFQIIQEIKKSDRTKHPIAFVMLDIDYFKNVNDTYGHPVGDQVLKKLSSYCMSQLRAIDSFGRVGGEEFLILLPEANELGAFMVAERIRQGVSELICAQVLGQDIKIQISLGISIYQPGGELEGLPHEIMKKYSRRSDLAMYQAKQAGRNQTKCWHE